jgi:hypothetical protein
MSNHDQSDYSAEPQGPTAALDALKEVSREPSILTEYRTIASAFTEDDYKAIIDLAWRHQFNVERLNFKRQLRELQEYVCSRIRLAAENEE